MAGEELLQGAEGAVATELSAVGPLPDFRIQMLAYIFFFHITLGRFFWSLGSSHGYHHSREQRRKYEDAYTQLNSRVIHPYWIEGALVLHYILLWGTIVAVWFDLNTSTIAYSVTVVLALLTLVFFKWWRFYFWSEFSSSNFAIGTVVLAELFVILTAISVFFSSEGFTTISASIWIALFFVFIIGAVLAGYTAWIRREYEKSAERYKDAQPNGGKGARKTKTRHRREETHHVTDTTVTAGASGNAVSLFA